METAEKCWKRCKPKENDILMVCVGATTGRLSVVENPPDMVLVRSVALIRMMYSYILPDYVSLVLRSPVGQSQIWGNVKQSAQPCLYLHKINALTVSIPPQQEQKRIVAKVDQLMALCDDLEAKLIKGQAKNGKLLEAAVADLLAA
jgi:type I restriction enzyme S subunit